MSKHGDEWCDNWTKINSDCGAAENTETRIWCAGLSFCPAQ